MREYFIHAGYLYSNTNKVKNKIRELKGNKNPKIMKSDDENNYKYTPKIKETQIKRLPTYKEGLKEWIEWKILY